MDYLLSAGYAWLLVLGLAVVVLLLGLAVVAVYGRAAGYAVHRGWDRASRDRAMRAPRYQPDVPAPRGGGLCAVGHYVPGSLTHCWFLHSYSARRTAGAAPGEVEQARHTHDTHKAESGERMAAGGW